MKIQVLYTPPTHNEGIIDVKIDRTEDWTIIETSHELPSRFMNHMSSPKRQDRMGERSKRRKREKHKRDYASDTEIYNSNLTTQWSHSRSAGDLLTVPKRTSSPKLRKKWASGGMSPRRYRDQVLKSHQPDHKQYTQQKVNIPTIVVDEIHTDLLSMKL